MFTDVQLKQITSLLKEADLDIAFDQKKFDAEIDKQGKAVAFETILARVQILVRLFKIDIDCELQRDAYQLLRHIHDAETVSCLTDNPDYLAEKIKSLPSHERLALCLNATLVGAATLAEQLFNKEACDPRENTYIVIYAICSGNNEWAKKLIKDYQIEITDEKYNAGFYAKKLNEFSKLYEELKAKKTFEVSPPEEKAKNVSSASQLTAFSLFESNSSYALTGELLESFDELILGELEILTDLKNENVKRLIHDMLFDPNYTPSEAAKYAATFGGGFGNNQFALIYCCMYPHKWDDPDIKDFKRVIINSYVERATEDNAPSGAKENKEKWLRLHARLIIKKFIAERQITAIKLTQDELDTKRKKLIYVRGKKIDLAEDAKEIEKSKELIEALNKEEGVSGYISEDLSSKSSLLLKPLEAKSLPATIDETDPRWDRIYDLIKNTPLGRNRPENKMLKVVRSILYKESSHCSWAELPQWSLPATTVRHYYYQWRTSRVLDQVKEVIANPISNSTSLSGRTRL